MASGIETYYTGEGDSRKFFLLVHGTGVGKFLVRKSNLNEENTKRYAVESVAGAARRFKSFIESVPKNIDQVFDMGALSIAYYEGEILIEFSDQFDLKDKPEGLREIAVLAQTGLDLLAKDFSVIEESYYTTSANRTFSPWLISSLSVICLCLCSILYGSIIIPLNWILISLLCFIIQIPVCVIFRTISKEFIKVGKVFFLAFLIINSISLMSLNGVLSLHFAGNNIRKEEGIVESFFEGYRLGHLMRIRFVSKRYNSFLVPVRLIETRPEVLPQAVEFLVRDGFLGSKYLDQVLLK